MSLLCEWQQTVLFSNLPQPVHEVHLHRFHPQLLFLKLLAGSVESYIKGPALTIKTLLLSKGNGGGPHFPGPALSAHSWLVSLKYVIVPVSGLPDVSSKEISKKEVIIRTTGQQSTSSWLKCFWSLKLSCSSSFTLEMCKWPYVGCGSRCTHASLSIMVTTV